MTIPETPTQPIVKPREANESIWIRGLFMLLFVLTYGVAEMVVLAVTVAQFGWSVATEEPNPRLTRFGANLSEFVYEVVAYWTFASNEKPYPFSDWPDRSESK